MHGKPARIISSWWLTFVLLLCLGISFISLASGQKPFERWINIIFHTAYGLTIYCSLIVNIISASIRIAFKNLGQRDNTPETIKDMDTYIDVSSRDISRENVIEWLKDKGLCPEINNTRALTVLKGRLSFLPGTLMRAGLLMFLIALLFSINTRKIEHRVLHEGEGGLFFGKKIYLKSIESGLPEELLAVSEKNTLMLDDISAVISISGREYSLTGGFPSNANSLYCRISNIGFSQKLSLKTSKKELSEDIDLDVLPPGKTAIISLPSEDMLFTFMLQPERIIKKGLVSGKVFNLHTPLYRVTIQRGTEKNRAENITARPGETSATSAGTMRLDKGSLFMDMQVVYDPALFWIYTGMLITLAGIILMSTRFFWYERQLRAVFTADRVLIGYREEFYKKWGIMKFHKWTESLLPDK